MFRNDEILSDPRMDTFSIDPEMQHIDGVRETGYRLMSDHIHTKYPDYYTDNYARLFPKESAKLVNFN